MDETNKPTIRLTVACPGCDASGRVGPIGSICKRCWGVGFIEAWLFDRIMTDHLRRGLTATPSAPATLTIAASSPARDAV